MNNSKFSFGIFTEVHAVVVPVSDMDESRKFFEGILGLTPRKILPEGFMTVYGTGGPTNICLYDAVSAGDKPGYARQGCFANFRTDDIEATRRHLVSNKVKCSSIVAGDVLSFFTFYDPDGNRFDVCQFGPAWLD